MDFPTYATRDQKSRAVSSGVVSQPNLDAITRKLRAVGSANNLVSIDPGVRNLKKGSKTVWGTNRHVSIAHENESSDFQILAQLSAFVRTTTYLGDHLRVRETNDEPVLVGVVFVFILNDQALAGVVVSLSLAPATVLDLVTLEISLVLDDFHETLCNTNGR